MDNSSVNLYTEAWKHSDGYSCRIVHEGATMTIALLQIDYSRKPAVHVIMQIHPTSIKEQMYDLPNWIVMA